MTTCIICNKEITNGCYNTPIGIYCPKCYTPNIAKAAISAGKPQILERLVHDLSLIIKS